MHQYHIVLVAPGIVERGRDAVLDHLETRMGAFGPSSVPPEGGVPKWDYWQIGGRWDGELNPDGDNGFDCNTCRVRDLPREFTFASVLLPDGEWMDAEHYLPVDSTHLIAEAQGALMLAAAQVWIEQMLGEDRAQRVRGLGAQRVLDDRHAQAHAEWQDWCARMLVRHPDHWAVGVDIHR